MVQTQQDRLAAYVVENGVRFFQLFSEFAMLNQTGFLGREKSGEPVSAWTRIGWLTRVAVIETFGGYCHGNEGVS